MSSHMCRLEKAILIEAEEALETLVVVKGSVIIEVSFGGEVRAEVLWCPELTKNLSIMHKICSRGHRVVFCKDVYKVFEQTD